MCDSDTKYLLDRENFSKLLGVLIQRDYAIVGPTIKDGAIVYDQIASVDDLPIGWTEDQEAGQYRLKRREDNALFGYNVGPESMKKFFHPPKQLHWQAKRVTNGFEILNENKARVKTAYLGVRACGLQAISIQDRVFTAGPYINESYRTKREDSFMIAVNCNQAGKTCFCVSMGSGPRANEGFDLALTEIIRNDEHCFLIEVGTEIGHEIVSDLHVTKATSNHLSLVDQILKKTANSMGRSMDTKGIQSLLTSNLDHPQWENVASRCLSCANCTMVCPTCFCTDVEDTTDLTGENAERWERWDSCFNLEFSGIHGGSIRTSTKSRYRQWLTHKLATWIDQFGTSGCIGCGRCITWCPVGIDITEEVKAIRETPKNSEEISSKASPQTDESIPR